MEKPIEAISPQAMSRLESYDWPGNVRELENTIERAVALESGPEISVTVLPERIALSKSEAVVASDSCGRTGVSSGRRRLRSRACRHGETLSTGGLGKVGRRSHSRRGITENQLPFLPSLRKKTRPLTMSCTLGLFATLSFQSVRCLSFGTVRRARLHELRRPFHEKRKSSSKIFGQRNYSMIKI